MVSAGDQSAVDHTALLLRLSRIFNSSLNLDEVLSSVMDEVIAALGAERGFIMLREPEGSLQFSVAHGLNQLAISDPHSEVSLSIANQVATAGIPLLTSNAQEDDRFSSRKSVIFLGLRSVLCVPLTIKGRILGVIYVDNRLVDGIFTPANLELLSAIASSAAIAIENARLYQVAVEKGRLERELQIARQMQTSLLPKEAPVYAGWNFCARWQPAHQVAGDFYDFIPLGKGQLGLLIGDVTDKGVPAAMFMALTRTILRTCLRKPATAAADIRRANRLICAESTMDYFVTLFYAAIDLPAGQMTYVNAGHPYPLWFRHADPAAITPLETTGIALGIDAQARFSQRTISMEPGDFFLAYTDGVTEAFNAQEEQYSKDRLCSLLALSSNSSPADILEAILHSVNDWSGGIEVADDITMLIASRLPSGTFSPGKERIA